MEAHTFRCGRISLINMPPKIPKSIIIPKERCSQKYISLSPKQRHFVRKKLTLDSHKLRVGVFDLVNDFDVLNDFVIRAEVATDKPGAEEIKKAKEQLSELLKKYKEVSTRASNFRNFTSQYFTEFEPDLFNMSKYSSNQIELRAHDVFNNINYLRKHLPVIERDINNLLQKK